MTRKVDSQVVWLDGQYVPADEAKVSFFAHALHYGTAVFEGVRCYDGPGGPAVFRLPEHLERLRVSAKAYFMEYDWSDEQITEATLELIRRHEFRECYIRPLVITGEGAMGVKPRDCKIQLGIAVWSWGAYLGPEALEKGIRVTVVEQRKYHPKALDPTVKAAGHYLNSVKAAQEATSKGYTEGLLLNHAGRVAEGPGENIFFVKDGRVITNPPEEALLLGITRDSVLRIVADLGLESEIRPFSPDELLAADEAFFTGTAAEVTPIASIDDHPIGSGSRGPITERVQSTYLQAVRGEQEAYRNWLTPVAVG